MMKKAEFTFTILSLPVDFLMLLSAGIVTYFLRTEIISSIRPVLFTLNLPFHTYFLLVLTVSLGFLIAYALSGLYTLRARRTFLHECARIVIASSAGIMGVIIVIFLRQALFDSRFLVLGFWLFAIVFVALGRLILRFTQRFLVARYGFGIHRVVLIGDDAISHSLAEAIDTRPVLGYRITQVFQNLHLVEIEHLAKTDAFDELLLTNPNYPAEEVRSLVDLCNEYHLVFKFVPNLHSVLTRTIHFDAIHDVPLIELKRTSLDGWGRVMKRVIDIIGAIIGLVILSPIFLLIGILIKLDSKGPVFVGLIRVSRNKHFKLYKFRSMIHNAEAMKSELMELNERKDGPLFKMRNDPRITRVGKVIRKYRIDELPQLWNVFKGDISLVGPRPHQPDEIAQYQKHHKRVLAIKAGVTGMAQVSGSSELPFEEEVHLDSLYIEQWSLMQDIKILLRTVTKLLFDHSAV